MYRWINIDDQNGFEQLDDLPPEFKPKVVTKKLTEGLRSSVRGVLVEHDYVDKDYRSTYYAYYAKKGRRYRSDCIRLHFFDGSVTWDETNTSLSSSDGRLTDHYFGYVVLRPTLHSTIGRSLLSPNIREGAEGQVIAARHKVHLLGYSLEVVGFPSMDQHVDIAVCAHVACWSILRHYSQRYPKHAEVLLHEVTRMAHQFDPGGLVPSNGLAIAEAERVFQAAGTYPLVVFKGKADGVFYSQLLAYLESGFPLFVGMKDIAHAVVLVGHSFDFVGSATQLPATMTGAWQMVSSFNVVDDNKLPYMPILGPKRSGLHGPASSTSGQLYTADSFDRFIVALPEKIYYPATAVEEQALAIAKLLKLPNPTDLVCRFFVTTLPRFRQEVRSSASQFDAKFIDVVMNLPAAQFIWVMEYATKDEWRSGNICARVLLDATASLKDPNPLWLAHTQSTAIVFDRSNGKGEAVFLDIKPVNNAPLARMNLNLRPIAAD